MPLSDSERTALIALARSAVRAEVLDQAPPQLPAVSGRDGIARARRADHSRQRGHRVNIQDLEAIGAKAIIDAAQTCQIIAIDEIGPMELYSEKFKQAVNLTFESKKLVLAIVHAKATDPLVTSAKQREDAEIFTVTGTNRDFLHEAIINVIFDALKQQS
jgi:nucleoside-triphosphatase